MADWYGKARSNYFRVNDEAKFRTWAGSLSLEVWEETKEGVKYFAMSPDDGAHEFGSWPNWVSKDKEANEDDESESEEEDDEEEREVDILQELAPFLAEGSVAVLMECGAEKLRYLTGWAAAVNSKGEETRVDIWDIYKAAAHLGTEVTQAQY